MLRAVGSCQRATRYRLHVFRGTNGCASAPRLPAAAPVVYKPLVYVESFDVVSTAAGAPPEVAKRCPGCVHDCLGTSLGAFAVPLALTAGLLALTLLPRIRANVALTWSFWGAAAVLLVWQAAAGRSSAQSRRSRAPPGQASSAALRPERVPAKRLRLLGMVLAAGLRLRAAARSASSFFAYAFDMLLAWSRREDYLLGFGPFPIVFSTNLFPVVQGRLVQPAVPARSPWAFSARRSCDGSATAGASTSSTRRRSRWRCSRSCCSRPTRRSLTWGQEIATTFSLGPRIYTVLFVIGLVVMYFFAITPVTAAAAATLFARERPLCRR